MKPGALLFSMLFCCLNGLAQEVKPATPADPSTPPAKYAPTDPSALALGLDKRKPHVPPKPGETAEMTVKELGNFNYDVDRGGNIPEDVKKMSGCSVRLRGYMIPLDQRENITQFALVPSLLSCCFGKPPQVHHSVISICPKGKAANYYADEIMVEGTLHVEEKKDEGYIVSIFQVDVTSVKPAPQKQ